MDWAEDLGRGRKMRRVSVIGQVIEKRRENTNPAGEQTNGAHRKQSRHGTTPSSAHMDRQRTRVAPMHGFDYLLWSKIDGIQTYYEIEL